MKALIWWLRSAFCKHDWKLKSEGEVIKAWPASMRGDLLATITVKECKKCGWLWQQRTGL